MLLLRFFVTVRGSDGQYRYRLSFFLSAHDNSRTAALSSMKFCTNMFLDNRSKTREFQSHRSKVKVTGPDFRIFLALRGKAKSLWTR